MLRDLKGAPAVIFGAFKAVMAKTTEEGSRTLVFSTLDAGEETHGKFLSQCTVKEPGAVVTSEGGEKMQVRVWDELMERLEEIQPRISSNL